MSRREVGEDGTVRYYNSEGKYHREDGPAIEWADGSKKWYINGKCHREGGPALECADGHKEWHINGKLHREDGPAIEWDDGRKSWYINDQYIRRTTTSHFAKLSRLSLRCFSFELFNYRQIERLISEELGLSNYGNFRGLVRIDDE